MEDIMSVVLDKSGNQYCEKSILIASRILHSIEGGIAKVATK